MFTEYEIRQIITAIIEEEFSNSTYWTFAVWVNVTGPWVQMKDGEMEGVEVLALEGWLKPLNLELAFTVNAARTYSRIQFRWIKPPAPEKKETPELGSRTLYDKGTTDISPIYEKYHRYLHPRGHRLGRPKKGE